MTTVEFKILLLKKGYTQKSLAEAIGCTQPIISQTINFYRPHKRIRNLMAKCLGVPYNKLWPDKTKAHKKRSQKGN